MSGFKLSLKSNFSRKEYLINSLKAFFSKKYRLSRDFFFYYYKKILPELGRDVNLIGHKSDLEIDLVLTVLPKDIDTLTFGFDKIQNNINHSINKVYIVSPKDDLIIDFCERNNAEFINEKEVLGFGKETFNYVHKGVDRSGWLFQQLLKWGVADLVEKDNYLILDADTFFIRNKTFEYKGKTILDFSDEYCSPYYITYEKLLGLKHEYKVSFVTHYMLLNKSWLQSLKKDIEKHTGNKWDQAIISEIDESQNSCFSEYETYANYVLTKFPDQIKIEYWFNKSLNKKEVNFADEVKKFCKENVKSLSFHTYNAKQ